MKIHAMHEKTGDLFVMTYEKNEWEMLEKKFVDIGLEKSHTSKGLGRGMDFDFYKLEKGSDAWLGSIRYKTANKGMTSDSFLDDINSPVIDMHRFFNIAVFRIVPDDKLEVKLPVDFFIASGDFNNFLDVAKGILEFVLNELNDMTATIVFRKKPVKSNKDDPPSEGNCTSSEGNCTLTVSTVSDYSSWNDIPPQ